MCHNALRRSRPPNRGWMRSGLKQNARPGVNGLQPKGRGGILAALKTARRAKPGHNKGVFTMANEDDVIRRVKEIIADRLDRKMEELSDDARIMDDLGADSLDTTEIIMALEEEFNLEIDDEANNIQTVGDAIKYIKARV